MIESLKTSTRAWINSSHSGDKRRERMWMSFKEWKQLWTTFKKIDKRRFERQLGEASKKLLTLPPKKRMPPQLSSLLHYHSTTMVNLLDYSSFPVFSRLSKKQLQHFYKSVRMRTYAPNTPLTCQGQHSEAYFVLMRGKVAVFQAGDKRQTELFNTVIPSVLKGPHPTKDLLAGYLGKPMYTITAPTERTSPGIGFGGVMLTKEKSDTWIASAVTLEEAEILVIEPKIFKNLFQKDHRDKYMLARRTKEFSKMPIFRSLPSMHLDKMSEDFRNNSYSSRATIVGVGDAFTKIIVVADGQVDITAKVEDPCAPGKLLDVTLARLGKGGIIGDVELIYSKSIFTLTAMAVTALVDTFEISRENFGSHVFDNSQSGDARKMLVKAAEEKAVFNLRRVKGEMQKFANFTRRVQEERAKAEGFKGDIADQLLYVKGEWERNYMNYVRNKIANAPLPPVPHHDYVHDDTLYIQRDVTSRSGVRVKSRRKKEKVEDRRGRGKLIPDGILKDESEDYTKPYINPGTRGSSRGGSRGGAVDFRAMMESAG